MKTDDIRKFEVKAEEKLKIFLNLNENKIQNFDRDQIEFLGYTLIDGKGKPLKVNLEGIPKSPKVDFHGAVMVNLERLSRFLEFAKKYGESAVFFFKEDYPLGVSVKLNSSRPARTNDEGEIDSEIDMLHYIIAPRVETDDGSFILEHLPPRSSLRGKVAEDKEAKAEKEKKVKELEAQIEALRKDLDKTSQTSDKKN